jgi:hypothetical protein
MKLRPTALALLAMGIPLTIYGVITYSNIVNEVNAGNCSLNPVSNLPKCEDAMGYGAVFVVGLVVLAGGIVSLVMSRKRSAVTTA